MWATSQLLFRGGTETRRSPARVPGHITPSPPQERLWRQAGLFLRPLRHSCPPAVLPNPNKQPPSLALEGTRSMFILIKADPAPGQQRGILRRQSICWAAPTLHPPPPEGPPHAVHAVLELVQRHAYAATAPKNSTVAPAVEAVRNQKGF